MVRACSDYSPDMVFYYHYQLPSMSLDKGLRYLEDKDDFHNMFELVRQGHKEIHVYVEHWTTLIHTGYSSFEADYSTDDEIPSSQHKDDDYESDDEEGDEKEDCDYVVDDCVIDEDGEKDIEEFKQLVVSEDLPFGENHEDDYDEGIHEIDLDDFESGSDSDKSSPALKRAMKMVRRKEKRASKNFESCPFYVGQKIDDKDTIKKMVKDYAVNSRRELFFAKNDKVRVVCIGSSLEPIKSDGNFGKATRKLGTGPIGSGDVKGKGVKVQKPRKKPPTPTCEWVLHCSRSDESEPFVVKTLKDSHKCLQTRDLGLYTMGYIAKEIVPVLETNPEIPLHSLQDQLQKNYQMNVSIQKVHRAKMIAQSDVLLNNICEVFNRELVGARDKPIYTCLEFIRTYLQKRIVNVKRMIARCDGPLTPAATRMFAKIKEEAAQYNVLMCGRGQYQVNGPWADQVVVDMDQKSCSCRRWDITGMPCRHVVAVIWDIARNNLGSGIPENYVARVYYLDTWKQAYEQNINPIPGKEHWLPSDCPTTLTPPKHHTPVGRPKKSRRKTLDEVQRSFNNDGKITRMGATTTCGKCKKQGHNSRSCKGQEQKTTKNKKSGGDSVRNKKAKVESHQSGSSQMNSQGAPTATQD